MNTYDYIINKFDLDIKSPVRLVFKRYDLAGLFHELGFKRGAEIGVYKGEYSEVLCMRNPDLKLYSIDPWTVYKSKEIEPFADNQEKLTEFYKEAKKRLAPYNCEIIKKTSMEAIRDFRPNSLDFVYIDANHDYKHLSNDLAGWARRVRRGGIVSGHDYGHFKHRDRNLGTKKAIDEYVQKHNLDLFLVNRNYQTTWFFVKQ